MILIRGTLFYCTGDSVISCSVWCQLGGHVEYEDSHPMKRISYPRSAEEALSFSSYLSQEGKVISLTCTTGICHACFVDCTRHHNLDKDIAPSPRWVKVQRRLIAETQQLHCPVCPHPQPQACNCSATERWAPKATWTMGVPLKLWNIYFNLRCDHQVAPIKDKSTLCHKHYLDFRRAITSRKCCVNGCHQSKDWHFALNSKSAIEMYLLYVKGVKETVNDIDWLCSSCSKAVKKFKNNRVSTDDQSDVSKIRALHVNAGIQAVLEKGFLLRKVITKAFKDDLLGLNCELTDLRNVMKSFDTNLSRVLEKTTEIGKCNYLEHVLLFDKNIFTEQSASKLLSVILENQKLEKENKSKRENTIKISDIKSMITKQVSLFLSLGKHFDYRQIFAKNLQVSESELSSYFLQQYLHEPLVNFIESITDVRKKKYKKSQSYYQHKDHLKIQMIISILCNIRNHHCILLQTMLGYTAFAGGLKEKFINMFHMFGITCSAKSISLYASFWSRVRNICKELNPLKFWRITFDNLNFKRKFAKTFTSGDGIKVEGRQLNLITGQVSHRLINTPEYDQDMSSAEYSDGTDHTLDVEMFFPQSGSAEENSWKMYMNSVVSSIDTSLGDTPLFERICDKMPNFTPSESDIIVPATVTCAQASSIQDVAAYLLKLKKDLRIGTSGYPKQVVIGGDQQTYNLMKQLITEYPDIYRFIVPVPGDWHLLKLASETLRDVAWNGGIKELAALCGHKKDLTQWKDIHNMLSAIYENLLIQAKNECPEHIQLKQWIDEKTRDSSGDEICNFWIKYLNLLFPYMGYHFAIRSGNFSLRNYCLSKLGHLFFSYSHFKYEALICDVIKDVKLLPPSIYEQFMNGEWTVSGGRPYHNVGLDESHEQVINKETKEITARASEFRTVTLAGFTGYLQTFMRLFKAEVFKHTPPKKASSSLSHLYSKQIFPVFCSKDLLKCQGRKLLNIFSSKPAHIDDEQRHDLLNIDTIGHNRMRNHLLKVFLRPTNKREKLSWKKCCTFSNKAPSNQSQKSKINQLSKVVQSTFTQLQKSGQYISRAVEFPLALCDEFGKLRSRNKSSFKLSLQRTSEFKEMFLDKNLQPTNFDKMTTEVILDFLKEIHKPPPPNITSFNLFANHLWSRIFNLAFSVANTCTIVIDKTEFLPPIRQLLHMERKEKSPSSTCLLPEKITGEEELPHGSYFTTALTNESFKKRLIDFVCFKFVELAMVDLNDCQTLIIDSSTFGSSPMMIKGGGPVHCLVRNNNKGEADFGVWHHTIASNCDTVIIHAADSDVYIYGLVVHELLSLDKHIFVQRSHNDYVDINKGVSGIQRHNVMKHIKLPCLHILLVYLISGSDYLPNFYNVKGNHLLDTLLQYGEYVSSASDPLITCNTGSYICDISVESFHRLIIITYLTKHIALFRHIAPTPTEFLDLLLRSSNNQSKDVSQLLDWLAYSTTNRNFNNTSDLLELTRRICYFKHFNSRQLLKMIPPSDSAIYLQKRRAEYLVTLVTQSCSPLSEHQPDCTNHGWEIGQNGEINFTWEENITEIKKELCKNRKLPVIKCGCMKSGCMKGTGSGCRSCVKVSRACTVACKCQGKCNNPWNVTNVNNDVTDNAASISDNNQTSDLNESDSEGEEELYLPSDLQEYFEGDLTFVPLEESDYDYCSSSDSDEELSSNQV